MEKQIPTRIVGKDVENYVLRIYRKHAALDKEHLVGVLEEPASGEYWSFASLQELISLLEQRD